MQTSAGTDHRVRSFLINVQSLQHHHQPRSDPRALPRDEPLRRQLAACAGRLPRLSGASGSSRLSGSQREALVSGTRHKEARLV